jgi:hypothetical protein
MKRQQFNNQKGNTFVLLETLYWISKMSKVYALMYILEMFAFYFLKKVNTKC